MAAITGESSSASLNSLFIILSLILSSFLFMLSQNNAHPSSSESMMPYDDDTLLANAHYIMKCPASQDETPKRLRLHSVIFFYLSRISRCCTIQCSLCGCHNKVTGCIGCCMNLVNNSVNTCYKTNNFKRSSYK